MSIRILVVSTYGLFPMVEFALAIMSEFGNADENYCSSSIGMQS